MSTSTKLFYPAFFSVCLFMTSVFAQELILSGVVRDQNTHQEIRSVNIFIKDSKTGTASDLSGRYRLRVNDASDDMIIVFRHIAYFHKEISLKDLENANHVDLEPRVIPLRGVEIEEEGIGRPEIEKDLRQTVSMIEARNFEIRGFTDAGDLLRVDHSVQVDEGISGRKTVSIRGGNPDDVVVLYNGVKLNNNFDNVYDFAMIDLENVERFEIIKGSNTAIYGPEAFSGVVNIVPKLEQDYTIRFQQRLGTYRSGNWGLHLYNRFDRLRGSYSLRRGGLERPFKNNRGELKNTSLHHSVNLNYNFSEENNLSLMGVFPTLEYDKRNNTEAGLEIGKESNKDQLYSVRYTGNLSLLKNIGVTVSYKKLVQEQFLEISNASDLANNGIVNRGIDDKAVHLNAEKNFNFGALELLFGYQFESAKLDFLDDSDFNGPGEIKNAKLKRNHHGFVSIAKYHGETGSDFLQTLDLSLSMRQDIIDDEQVNLASQSGNGLSDVTNNWNDSTLKFSMNLAGYRSNLLVNGFLTFGKNIKFPTLFQQINSTNSNISLNPEKNSSLELGFIVSRDLGNGSAINGFQAEGNYFQNTFDDKIITFSDLTSLRSQFKSVPDANISGFESKSSVFLFRKKVTVGLGLSRYYISDKAAFPFKSDFKRTLNLAIDHLGYSFQILWFKEGEQVATLFFPDGTLSEPVPLESYENLDVHLSKTFEVRKLKLFVNASGRNLLDDDNTELQGLALRDRRYYVTFGAQY